MTTPPERLQDFFAALRPRVSGALRSDPVSRALYSTDASLYRIEPLGVLVPVHADDVQAAVEEAARFGLPVLARGSGSSLAGQAVGEALVVDCTRHLDQVLEVDAEERWVRVQPGVILDHLNAALRPRGLMVGPDPASSDRATLGGMTANNATGAHSILYGSVVDHLQSARVVLADGSRAVFEAAGRDLWRQRARLTGLEGRIYDGLVRLLEAREEVVRRDTPRHWRRSGGYRLEQLLDVPDPNLARLLCGSEGTLAVATELRLSLVPRPVRTALGVVHFQSRRAALEAVETILETEPSAVELFDRAGIERCRHVPEFARRLTFLQGEPGALLITEYFGVTPEELAGRLGRLEDALRARRMGEGVVRALTPDQIANVWAVRKAGLGLVMGVRGDAKPIAFIEDAAVPVAHLAEYIERLEALLDEAGTTAAVYAHASAGCLHVRPFLNLKDARDVARMKDLAEGSMALVAEYGGILASEHGEGLSRSWLSERFFGPELYDTYRQVKHLFDPAGVLNPGKKVNAPPMTENLRIGPTYRTVPFVERLDFSEEGGFARAVEGCTGVGACRKLTGGTMCPSFMVTREEEHSTRGRANALRAALSGELPPEALTGERMYEVLDLCIECKGCKAECPSGVDLAKIKFEWLGHYWDEHRMPLRTRLFAELPRWSRRLAGPGAGLVNWMNNRPRLRRFLNERLGLSDRRTLPPFAREPFTTWFERRRPGIASGRPVVLFHDTFHTYHHPEVSRAAVEVLEKAGYAPVLPGHRCCGRPLISKGLVEQARAAARETVERLYPYAEADLPIVGLEPSCILSLRDEYLALLPGDARAAKVAGLAFTFEEFFAHQADSEALPDLKWRTGPRRVLLHGHCHQKALVGLKPALRTLSLPTGYAVETVDSGCCGMAGSFGYEAEHYALSLAMAERRLAPAIRAAPSDTLIVAAGVSCRAQIAHTTGRTALHPAQVLRDALG